MDRMSDVFVFFILNSFFNLFLRTHPLSLPLILSSYTSHPLSYFSTPRHFVLSVLSWSTLLFHSHFLWLICEGEGGCEMGGCEMGCFSKISSIAWNFSLTVGFGNEVIWFCCGWLVGWLRYERRVKQENKENKKERRGRGRIERCGVYILALFSRFHSLSVLLCSFPSSNLHALIFLPFPCSLCFTTSLPPPIPPLINHNRSSSSLVGPKPLKPPE